MHINSRRVENPSIKIITLITIFKFLKQKATELISIDMGEFKLGTNIKHLIIKQLTHLNEKCKNKNKTAWDAVLRHYLWILSKHLPACVNYDTQVSVLAAEPCLEQ